jgi:hypothetical protein
LLSQLQPATFILTCRLMNSDQTQHPPLIHEMDLPLLLAECISLVGLSLVAACSPSPPPDQPASDWAGSWALLIAGELPSPHSAAGEEVRVAVVDAALSPSSAADTAGGAWAAARCRRLPCPPGMGAAVRVEAAGPGRGVGIFAGGRALVWCLRAAAVLRQVDPALNLPTLGRQCA